jgi:hypothetical protein
MSSFVNLGSLGEMSQGQIVYFSNMPSEFSKREMGWRIAQKSQMNRPIHYDKQARVKILRFTPLKSRIDTLRGFDGGISREINVS